MCRKTDYTIERILKKSEIYNAITLLGSSLFDQLVNNSERIDTLAEKYADYGTVIVLVINDSIVGLCAFYNNDQITKTAYLSMLVVEKSSQGCGCGRCLLNRMEEICKASGTDRIRLSISKDNGKAAVFYSRHGYVLEQVTAQSAFYVKRI